MAAERGLQIRSVYNTTELPLLCLRDMAGFCPGVGVRESKFSGVILIQKRLDCI